MDNASGPRKDQKVRAPPPALNPESCALVQPYKDFLMKGYFTSLNVEFTPLGNRVFCNLRDDLLKSGETLKSNIAIGDGKQRIIDNDLWTPGNRVQKAKGEETRILPKKSLCKEDFSKSDLNLSARAEAVAKALTDTVARGRIGSLKLMIEGCDTFEKWWKDAAPSEKSRLLADKKHHDSFTESDHIRLNKIMVKCPFRGPVPTPSPEEEEAPRNLRPQTSSALVPKRNGNQK